MKKIHIVLFKLMLLLGILSSIPSCTSDDDLNDLHETIFVRHKNADMPAYIRGNGNEKVFLITLHGGPGDIGLGFRGKAFDLIENDYGVVYFDQRGSGMSQGSYNQEELTLDLMAQDVLALVKVLQHKYGNDSQFFLLGHSWGGTLGTATLLKDQTIFKGWIDVDGASSPTGLFDQYLNRFTTEANSQIALGNSIEFWESTLEFVSEYGTVNSRDNMLELNSKAFELEGKLQDDGFISNPDDGTNDENIIFQYNLLTTIWNSNQIADILVFDQSLFQTTDFTGRFQELTLPTLFISGQYDMIVPTASSQTAFDNVGSNIKDLQIFEDSGHAPMFSEAERFATSVLTFMNDNKD